MTPSTVRANIQFNTPTATPRSPCLLWLVTSPSVNPPSQHFITSTYWCLFNWPCPNPFWRLSPCLLFFHCCPLQPLPQLLCHSSTPSLLLPRWWGTIIKASTGLVLVVFSRAPHSYAEKIFEQIAVDRIIRDFRESADPASPLTYYLYIFSFFYVALGTRRFILIAYVGVFEF